MDSIKTYKNIDAHPVAHVIRRVLREARKVRLRKRDDDGDNLLEVG